VCVCLCVSQAGVLESVPVLCVSAIQAAIKVLSVLLSQIFMSL